MPTYSYRCTTCAAQGDYRHGVHAAAPACRHCGGEQRKRPTAPAIAFKGGGFYATDSRRKPQATKA